MRTDALARVGCRSRRPRRLAALAALGIVVMLASGSLSAQKTEGAISNGVLSLRVENETDPLYFAVEKLSTLCQCPISFEEPEWAHADDIDVVQGTSRPLKTVKRGSMQLSEPVRLPIDRRVVVDLVQQLIAQHESLGRSARFQVLSGRAVQVIPTTIKRVDGSERAAEPLLNTSITMSPASRSPHEWLQTINVALYRAVHKKVEFLYSAQRLQHAEKVHLSASKESTRAVLERLFEAMQVDAAWLVSYSPTFDSYAVKLNFFPREAGR